MIHCIIALSYLCLSLRVFFSAGQNIILLTTRSRPDVLVLYQKHGYRPWRCFCYLCPDSHCLRWYPLHPLRHICFSCLLSPTANTFRSEETLTQPCCTVPPIARCCWPRPFGPAPGLRRALLHRPRHHCSLKVAPQGRGSRGSCGSRDFRRMHAECARFLPCEATSFRLLHLGSAEPCWAARTHLAFSAGAASSLVALRLR